MKHLKVGIDVDGVLADFNHSFVKLVAEQTGIVLNLPPKTWTYHLDNGVTPEQDKALWQFIAESRNFWSRLTTLDGTVPFLLDAYLLATYADLYFITTRVGVSAKRQTEDWLIHHGYVNPTVIVSSKKGDIAKGLGLSVLIDDRPENLFAVKDAQPDCCTILFRAPYNAWAESDPRIDTKVNTLVEATERIEELS